MRILLDSNTLFSALIYDGNERFLIEEILAGRHILVLTDLILAEVLGVLERKLRHKYRRAAEEIFRQIQNSPLVYVKQKTQYRKLIIEARKYINEKDAPILAAVMQPEVDMAVSGDKAFIRNPKLNFLRKKKIFTTGELIILMKAAA